MITNPASKLIACFCLTLFVTGVCLAQDPSAGTEVNLRIRGVGLGTRHATVLRKLGKPQRAVKERVLDDQACSPPYTTLTLHYDGLEVRLDGDIRGRDFRVVMFEVTSAKWLVAPGVRIGSSEGEVRTRLGKPWWVRDESGLRILNYVTKGNEGKSVLDFRDGKLAKITWSFTLC